MFDDDIFWSLDDKCTVTKYEIVSTTDDYLWDDFDESDWISDHYDKYDLWDAIKNGECYDDFVDKMREDCSNQAWDLVTEGLAGCDEEGDFEVCGSEFCAMHSLVEYF